MRIFTLLFLLLLPMATPAQDDKLATAIYHFNDHWFAFMLKYEGCDKDMHGIVYSSDCRPALGILDMKMLAQIRRDSVELFGK